MEDIKVKELRRKYGINDSRNEYTEEQLITLSKKKLFYIRQNRESETDDIHIEYKQVLGYVSNDNSSCIFIKDNKITGNSTVYMPMKRISDCKEIKKGIYHERFDNIIYCTIEDDLEYCLEYLKEVVQKEIQEQIMEMEQELLKLKNANILLNHII